MGFRQVFQGVQPRRTPPVRSGSRLLLEELEPRIALAGDPGPFGHDPSVVKQGNWYYLFGTGGTIPVQKSTDLVHWQSDGSVFATIPAWVRAQLPRAFSDIWAPDISYFDGVYHLYYAVASSGGNDSVIGLVTNVTLDRGSPSYRWVDRGMVIRSYAGQSTFNAIDPNAVLDTAGNLWLDFGSFYGGIKMRQLDRATGLLSGGNTQTYSLAARPSPDAVEGPFIFPHGSYYYLFASFDYCCRGADSDYKTVVGRSPSITGPYVDRSGRRLDQGGGTQVLSSYDDVRGPGGESVFHDASGDWLVHHFYDANDQGRAKVQFRPLVWGPDGWPLAGEPYHGLPPLTADITAGTWRQSVAFGLEVGLRFYPNGRINDPNGPNYWTLQGDVLAMHWPDPRAPGGEWVDTCVLSADGRWLVGRNQADAVIRARRAVLPSGWADGDIGSPGVPGYADDDPTTGTWTVAGGGSDISNTADQFHFASENLAGDGSIVARVTAVQDTDPWAKAGVMVRDGVDPGAAFADVMATPGNGVIFQWRDTPGGPTAKYQVAGLHAPVWVRLARAGDDFSGYYSADGVTWTQVGRSHTVVMNPAALVGLAVTSHNNATLNGATFTNVSLLSAGWGDVDIGGTGRPGYADFNPDAGTWAVGGSGADIFSTADAFHFVYRPLTGDGEVTARVTAVGDTGAYAKAGVMVRETLAADSRHALVNLTPGHGAELVRRTATGGTSASTFDPAAVVPSWVRLVRRGDSFTAYDSPDGVNWNWMAGATIPMAQAVYAGLAVCAFNNAVVNASAFDSVSVIAQADLSGSFNQTGVVSDGAPFSGGLDGNGDAYSATLLGPALSANGYDFNLGAADTANAIQAAGQTVSLPAGPFSVLSFLGTGVNGPQPGQTFVVNYADGTSDTFTQDLSDWLDPQAYAGESVAAVLSYYNYLDGSSPAVTNDLYQYHFTLNNQKTVSSITLPDNGNVSILAIDLGVWDTANPPHSAARGSAGNNSLAALRRFTGNGRITGTVTGSRNTDPWTVAAGVLHDRVRGVVPFAVAPGSGGAFPRRGAPGGRPADAGVAGRPDLRQVSVGRGGRVPTVWTPRRRVEAIDVVLAELGGGPALVDPEGDR